jgi:hypothetical protein
MPIASVFGMFDFVRWREKAMLIGNDVDELGPFRVMASWWRIMIRPRSSRWSASSAATGLLVAQ